MGRGEREHHNKDENQQLWYQHSRSVGLIHRLAYWVVESHFLISRKTHIDGDKKNEDHNTASERKQEAMRMRRR